MGKLTRIGLDTSKNVFQLHGVDDSEQLALKRKVRRHDFGKFFGSLSRVQVGMEACGASHHWARELQALRELPYALYTFRKSPRQYHPKPAGLRGKLALGGGVREQRESKLSVINGL